MCARDSRRLLSIGLLIVLWLTQVTGVAWAARGAPEALTITVLPLGSGAEIVPADLVALPAKSAPGRLESTLMHIATAYAAGDSAALSAFAAHPHVSLADEHVRIVMEMAIPIEAQVTEGATEVVTLPGGERVTIEHAPNVTINPIMGAMIQGAGAHYETASQNLVQVWAPFSSLTSLSDLPGVSHVRLPYSAQPAILPARSSHTPSAPQAGALATEGVVVAGAGLWHSAGFDGAGVNVAVFDFGFTGWAARETAGDLPPGSRLVQKDFSADYDFSPDTAGYEHGTACAEVAYDMAPGSTIYLYAFNTDVEFANAVNDYRTNVAITGKKVATMSVGWVNAGPYDGTGSINAVVNNAQADGILWVNSVGNNRKAHWSGTAAQYGTGHSVAFGAGNVQGVGPASGSLWNIASGTELRFFLEWNDWNAGRTGNQSHIDYDIYLLRWTGAGWTLVASSIDNQCATAVAPIEGIAYTVPNGGPYNYGILIQRYATASCPNNFGHWLQLHSFNSADPQNLFWYTSECNSVVIPSDGDSAVAAGAIFWNEDGAAPLYGLESFSGCGPRNAPGGGQPVGAINKPDVVAPDGVSTVTYGASNGVSFANNGAGFWGTSAAAPHVAGMAASAWSGRPDLTLAQLRGRIQSKAVIKGDGDSCGGVFGGQNNRYGYGRIALGSLPIAGLWDGGGVTGNWSEAANWDNGAVPGASIPILFDSVSTKDAVVDADVVAASLTLAAGYTGVVTLGGSLTVSSDVELAGGTLDVSASNYPLAIGGSFGRSGGTFTPRAGVVTFNGAGVQSINGDLAFNDLTVSSGTTLTTSSHVTVGGTLTNNGWTIETRAVGETGALAFGLAQVGVDIVAQGSLSSLEIARRDQSYGGAPVAVQTGKYWTISPTGAGFVADLTLPHAALTDPSACRNMGAWWDCLQSSSTGATVTRSGITEFSDWSVGSSVQPPVAPAPVTAAIDAGNTRLDWMHVPANANGYQVWWSSDPYFAPGAGANYTTAPAPAETFTQPETAGASYYYVVLGVNSAHATSGSSNRIGKFVFELAPGSATP